MDDAAHVKTALADRYTIEREIGRGGMATVYLARDLKHARNVALKVLSPELGAILGVERFLAEIRVTANLQHPNLLPLFDSGEADGLLFYVMPFVEGESLRHRIDREKQLPVDEAVRIAAAIASALDYAHRHGVIHRDLKPDNVLLHDGQPLLADFGIALAVANAGGTRVTQTGLSLGTPQYMSPEQATGDRNIDGRTDIYSLGALTYEMLSGEPPHVGTTAQAVIARLMTEDPRPLSAVRRAVPAHVEGAVQCALEKLPADRFATAKEFGDALQGRIAPALMSSAHRTTKKGARGLRALPWIVAAAATLAASVAGAAWWSATHVPPSAPVRFTVQPPRGTTITDRGSGLTVALSPDGQTIAFVGGADDQIFLRRLGELTATPLARATRATDLWFSADGRWLAYKGQRTISKIPVAAGETNAEPTRLVDNLATWAGLAWINSPDVVFISGDTLWAVSDNGARRVVAAADRRAAIWTSPFILPDGETVAFRVLPREGTPGVSAGRLALVSLAGGSPTVTNLVMDNVIGYADGALVFGRTGRVMAIRLDVAKRAPSGEAVTLVENVRSKRTVGAVATLSRNGTLAYLTGTLSTRLDIIDDRGQLLWSLDDAPRFSQPAWSPDGKRIAMTIADERPDLWMYDTDSRVLSRLTQGGTGAAAAWTPDGKRIGFANLVAGVSMAYWMPADGSGAAEPIPGTAELTRVNSVTFSRDGAYAILRVSPIGKTASVFAVPLGTPNKAIPMLGGSTYGTSVSPNGKWLSYTTSESGRMEVFVSPFPNGSGRVQVSSNGGDEPRWSSDGRRLFYRGPTAFLAASLDISGAMPRVLRSDSLFSDIYQRVGANFGYDVHPDGKRFVVTRDTSQGRQLVVVTNWLAEMRSKMSGR